MGGPSFGAETIGAMVGVSGVIKTPPSLLCEELSAPLLLTEFGIVGTGVFLSKAKYRPRATAMAAKVTIETVNLVAHHLV